MNISYSGTHTREDLLRFDRAARKALGSPSLYTNAGCMGVAALVVLILAIVQWSKGNPSGAFAWFMFFVVLAVSAPMQAWSARRAFGRHPNLNQPMSGELRDDGVFIRAPNSESTIGWDAFSSAFCTADYLILISTTQALYGFGSDFFSTTEDFTRACELAQGHVRGKPPGASPRRRVMRILGWIVLAVFIVLVWLLLQTKG